MGWNQESTMEGLYLWKPEAQALAADCKLIVNQRVKVLQISGNFGEDLCQAGEGALHKRRGIAIKEWAGRKPLKQTCLDKRHGALSLNFLFSHLTTGLKHVALLKGSSVHGCFFLKYAAALAKRAAACRCQKGCWPQLTELQAKKNGGRVVGRKQPLNVNGSGAGFKKKTSHL